MKINRVALRGAVQKTLDAAETQHAEQVKAWEQWFEDYQTKWIDKWNPQWASAIDVIRLAITKGRVITDDMLPPPQRAHRDLRRALRLLPKLPRATA